MPLSSLPVVADDAAAATAVVCCSVLVDAG